MEIECSVLDVGLLPARRAWTPF